MIPTRRPGCWQSSEVSVATAHSEPASLLPLAVVTWVRSRGGRATIDIIESCGITIFLCCWSSLCVNFPSVGDGVFVQLCDKWYLACIGMLGPEILFALAFGPARLRLPLRKQIPRGRIQVLDHAICLSRRDGGLCVQCPHEAIICGCSRCAEYWTNDFSC